MHLVLFRNPYLKEKECLRVKQISWHGVVPLVLWEFYSLLFFSHHMFRLDREEEDVERHQQQQQQQQQISQSLEEESQA